MHALHDDDSNVERHQTSNSPGERQRGPPEISPAFSVGPPQHSAPRSGNPQLTRKPAPQLSDEPAANGNPWTPPPPMKHCTASTDPSGLNQTAVWQHPLTVTTARSGTGSAHTRSQEAIPGTTGTHPELGSPHRSKRRGHHNRRRVHH